MSSEELARTMPINTSTINRKIKPKAVVGGLEVKNLDWDHSLSRLEGECLCVTLAMGCKREYLSSSLKQIWLLN